MTTIEKKCEICEAKIPDDFQNNLCINCYNNIVEENEKRKEFEKQEQIERGTPTVEEIRQSEANPHIPVVSDPNYTPNPQQDEIDLVQRNYAQFVKTGKWLWKPTRTMYEFIRDSFIDIVKSHSQYPKFVWKPTVCDIGSGSGAGSNILSQEADFVWGIDKNPHNVRFATELFARHKNNIYYTPEIRFDTIDIQNPPPNIEMKFDCITAIEILEHLEDPEVLLKFMKSIARPESIFWISTPNRNSPKIQKDRPKNKYHTMELTSQEFMALLKKHFKMVQFYNSAGEKCEEDTTHTPILALTQGII